MSSLRRNARVELLHWAEPHQRQTKRFQQHLALDAFSMPPCMCPPSTASRGTRCDAPSSPRSRWEQTRPNVPLRQAGIDEKWLGRRHEQAQVRNHRQQPRDGRAHLERLRPQRGHRQALLDTLTAEQKAGITLFAMDMHRPFLNAVRADLKLAHAVVCHDLFHIMKRAGEAISELRRKEFFRAGLELRALGRGTRWPVLRARGNQGLSNRLVSANCSPRTASSLALPGDRGTPRGAPRAPPRAAPRDGLHHVLYRTEKRANVPMRKLHDSLQEHFEEIAVIGSHRPPTGRL
ncbi:MAG: transposase [Sandaracinus sp.]